MFSPTKKVFYANYVFEVPENVYEPAEDSFLFADNLDVKAGESVVDMGTGCGILGIVVAEKAKHVVAIDANPYAVYCAKRNAKLNNVAEKMSFLQSDLFSSICTKEKIDLILFNAPYLPEDAKNPSWLEKAWTGGISGRQVIDRFIPQALTHLEKGGRILLMQSTLSDVSKTLKALEEKGLETHTIAKCDLPFFETIVLIEAKN